MFTPQFLLVALAIMIIVIYLPALAHPKKFRKGLRSFASEKEAIRSTGASILLLALIFLAVQWKFSKDWMILIPILGWLSFIKGVVFIWNPEFVKKVVKKWRLYSTDGGITAMAIIAIIASVALIYIATEIMTGIELVSG